jgi:hypothetical protein
MTPAMGRRKTLHPDLPPRMTARGKPGKLRYYYGQAKKPLGSDFVEACRQWAILERGQLPNSVRYVDVADRWEREAIHIGRRKKKRSPKTQRSSGGAEAATRRLQGRDARPDQAEARPPTTSTAARPRSRPTGKSPSCRSSGTGRAARGLPTKANPCAGIDRTRSRPHALRDRRAIPRGLRPRRYVLQDAMDLLLLTSHNPSDILRLTRARTWPMGRSGCAVARPARRCGSASRGRSRRAGAHPGEAQGPFPAST